MRLFQLLFLLTVVCCNANNTSASNVNGQISKEKETDPLMGGPSEINIKFTDYNQSGTAKIIGFYSDQNFLADTIKFENGHLQYKNPKGLPQGLYYFLVPNRNENLQLILGEDQQFDIEVSMADIPNTIKITGSEENRIFYENAKLELSLNPQISALNQKLKTLTSGTPEYAEAKMTRDELEAKRLGAIRDLLKTHPNLLFTKYKNAGQNPKLREDVAKDQQVYFFRREFWDNVDFNDRRLLRTPVIGNKLKKYMKEFTAQNQDSVIASAKFLMEKIVDKPEYLKVIANWIVLTYEPGKCELMDAEAVFVYMVQNFFTKQRAFWQDTLQTQVIQQRAMEMAGSLIGKPAPNVVSKDQMGQRQELLKLTADYIIVYMFNPDCEHCQEQTPKLVQYYNEHKGQIDVFAIAVDTEEDKWKDYIRKNNLTWTNVYDPTNRSIYAKYFVDHTPELYVINKERKIIGKNLKVFQVQTIIDRDKAKRGS